MPDIQISQTDEREIKVPVPGGTEAVGALADFFQKAAGDGYSLKSASDIRGGDQRDPYVVGVKIRVSRG